MVVPFAGAWIAVAAVGGTFVTLDTPRYNATTDLYGLRAVLAKAPAPVSSYDLQDLALSFHAMGSLELGAQR